MSGTQHTSGYEHIDPTLLDGMSFDPADVYVAREIFGSTGTKDSFNGPVSLPGENSRGQPNFLQITSPLAVSAPANSQSPVKLLISAPKATSPLFAVQMSQGGNLVGVNTSHAASYEIVGWNADAILLANTHEFTEYQSGIIVGNANLAGDIAQIEASGGYMHFSTNPDIPIPVIDTGLTDANGNEITINVAGHAPVTCFAEGTRIATPAGAVAIEDLAEGDLVCTLSGAARPIRWVGRRSFDGTAYPQPARIAPVEIAAGAFGPGLPARALRLSPEHALFLDGAMVPVQHLVNGTTICQQPEAAITYYHIELPRHDVVLAEGLAAETYLDTGNRDALIRRDSGIAQAA